MQPKSQPLMAFSAEPLDVSFLSLLSFYSKSSHQTIAICEIKKVGFYKDVAKVLRTYTENCPKSSKFRRCQWPLRTTNDYTAHNNTATVVSPSRPVATCSPLRLRPCLRDISSSMCHGRAPNCLKSASNKW